MLFPATFEKLSVTAGPMLLAAVGAAMLPGAAGVGAGGACACTAWADASEIGFVIFGLLPIANLIPQVCHLRYRQGSV